MFTGDLPRIPGFLLKAKNLQSNGVKIEQKCTKIKANQPIEKDEEM